MSKHGSPESRQKPSAAQTTEAPALGVTALSQLIRSALEGALTNVRVTGEISNFRAVQGHWYFSLKDATSRIDCMMFRSVADQTVCAPVDGMAVILTGSVTHYPPQGRTQIQGSKMEAVGAGDLDARYRQLCNELRALGYFDSSQKVAIPAMPMCIALLTSANSAAEADCLDAAARAFPATRIIAVDIRVQGSHAAAGIAAAIAAVDAAASRRGIDVILLVRGGGSQEDLWAFNERIVADAIRSCKTPIVTGVGHESDTTIADLVADRRAATPSRAVTDTLPSRDTLREQLDGLARHLTRAQGGRVQRDLARFELAARSRGMSDPRTGLMVHASALARIATALAHVTRQCIHRRDQARAGFDARLARLHPANRITTEQTRTTMMSAALVGAGTALMQSARNRVDSAARTLHAIGPQAVLDRGYSITVDASGTPIRRAMSLNVGERVETLLADGRVGSVIDQVVIQRDGGSLDCTP